MRTKHKPDKMLNHYAYCNVTMEKIVTILDETDVGKMNWQFVVFVGMLMDQY